jgi:hypothetical protein
MSRDASPPPRKFTRRILHERVRVLFDDFAQWSVVIANVPLGDIVPGPDSDEGDAPVFSFKACIDEIANACWIKKIKLPTSLLAVDTFILICVALDWRKYGYNLHLAYHHWMTKYLKQTPDYFYIRYKVLRSAAQGYPGALLAFLHNAPLIYTTMPATELDLRKLRRVARAIACWTQSKVELASQQYEDVADEIANDFDECLKKMWKEAGRKLEATRYFSDYKEYLYNNELHFSELPVWHRLAILFKLENNYYLPRDDIRGVTISLATNGGFTADDFDSFKAQLVMFECRETIVIAQLKNIFIKD